VALAVLLTACAGDTRDDWGDGEGSEIMSDLRVPAVLGVVPTLPDATGSFARATFGATRDNIETEAVLPVLGGHIEVQSLESGLLVLNDVLVDFIEVPIDAEVLPPRGLTLTGIQLRLSTPTAIEVAHSGARVTAIATFDLVADWSVDLGEGDTHSLRSIPLRGMPFSIDLERDAFGTMRGRLVALGDGVFWSWADLFSLSDLTLDLSVTAAI
jgi:hypothetical protein